MKIGVDGGGTKTELILVDAAGHELARHLAPGCNPSVAGPDQARLVLTDALAALLERTRALAPTAPITHTLLCLAGSPLFWREFADGLRDFGVVTVHDDSLPVLELATAGAPGLVLHAGTGSFVAARAPDGTIHYAGGLGWRFGDPASGYEIGRRTVARGLLELQGWATPTRLGDLLRTHTGLATAREITRFFYQHAEPNRPIAALAPFVLHLATEGDHAAHQLLLDTTAPLLDLAVDVARRLFPGRALDTLPAGLSGPILTHASVRAALTPRSPLALTPVTDTPIEGVRRLLARLTA